MKYIYLVQSDYVGNNAQGNVLGAHSSLKRAMLHFNAVRTDRTCRTKSKIEWDHGPERLDAFTKYKRVMAKFYVNDARSQEYVKLIKMAISDSDKKRRKKR